MIGWRFSVMGERYKTSRTPHESDVRSLILLDSILDCRTVILSDGRCVGRSLRRTVRSYLSVSRGAEQKTGLLVLVLVFIVAVAVVVLVLVLVVAVAVVLVVGGFFNNGFFNNGFFDDGFFDNGFFNGFFIIGIVGYSGTAGEGIGNSLVLLEFPCEVAFAEEEFIPVTLVRRIVCLQALDHSVLSCFIEFLRSPEHTGGRLLDEDCGDIAFFGGNFEGGFAADVDLLEEFNLTGIRVDQHEADVGGFAGLEGDLGGGGGGLQPQQSAGIC